MVLEILLKTLSILSIISGFLAALTVVPGEVGGISVVVYAIATKIRSVIVDFGDKLDDGEINGSFNPDKEVEDESV